MLKQTDWASMYSQADISVRKEHDEEEKIAERREKHAEEERIAEEERAAAEENKY